MQLPNYYEGGVVDGGYPLLEHVAATETLASVMFMASDSVGRITAK